MKLMPCPVQQAVHDKLVQRVDKVAELVGQHMAVLQGLVCTRPPCLHPHPFQAPLGPPDLSCAQQLHVASQCHLATCITSYLAAVLL